MIHLAAEGNPDFDEPRNIGVPPRIVAVETMADASAAAREYIKAHNLGGGNWIGGEIRDLAGNEVARVSYNGRIWDLQGKEIAPGTRNPRRGR
jgi:hypothetical protein